MHQLPHLTHKPTLLGLAQMQANHIIHINDFLRPKIDLAKLIHQHKVMGVLVDKIGLRNSFFLLLGNTVSYMTHSEFSIRLGLENNRMV